MGLLALLAAIGRIFSSLLASEAKGRLDRNAEPVVEEALRRLPEEYRERYRDEWEGDLATYADMPVSGMWLAHRIRRDAKRLAIELVGQPAPDRTSTVTGWLITPVFISALVGGVVLLAMNADSATGHGNRVLMCLGATLIPTGFYGLVALGQVRHAIVRLVHRLGSGGDALETAD